MIYPYTAPATLVAKLYLYMFEETNDETVVATPEEVVVEETPTEGTPTEEVTPETSDAVEEEKVEEAAE